MRTASWVHIGLGLASALAAYLLWRSYPFDIRNSEEARAARTVANVGLEPLGRHIDAPTVAPPLSGATEPAQRTPSSAPKP